MTSSGGREPGRLASGLALIAAAVAIAVAALCSPPVFRAASPITYRFTFPEAQHRRMQVEATFPDLDARPLELRMSRSSPGRYSLHDFAKNVWDVHAFADDGRELTTSRPDPYGWDVAAHGPRVTVKYTIYGDRVDGTYLAIDTTHAHINMPAAIMWARGLDDRPATVTFVAPPSAAWRVATQLHAGSTPFEFTAPNLQYLMDSPAEFGPIAMRQFTAGSRTFRFSLHHQGTDAELDSYVKDVEKIVEEEGAIYGEFPAYEPGTYTFLADYLPYASGDGMEHRNSTVMTQAGELKNPDARRRALDTVAHEFFHGWNVERIRPRSIEPFDFERANMSGELWLAEGFTQYYGPLVLLRAGLIDLAMFLGADARLVNSVVPAHARLARSAVEMSQMAPFIDGGRAIDRTNWSDTVISYYDFGGAIALALDLSLRERSAGRVSLDDYMRALWRNYGKPGGTREGYVDRPYTLADAEATLGEVSGDRAFARDFFARYITGHEAADYRPLLANAGLLLGPQAPGRAWWGDLRLEGSPVVKVVSLVSSDTPAYAAGLEQDDEIREIGGSPVRSPDDVAAALGRHRPGERVPVVFVERDGRARTVSVALVEDPRLDIVPAEATGARLTPAQRSFRERWLASDAAARRLPRP